MDFDAVPLQGVEDEAQDCMGAQASWAKDIEWPHGHHRNSGLAMVGLDQMFSGQLGDGVAPAGLGRGTDGRGCVFVDAEGVHSKDLAGRKIEKPLQA